MNSLTKLTLLTLLLLCFGAYGQTTNPPPVMETNTVKIVMTADEWKLLRREWKFEMRFTGNTNTTFGQWQDAQLSAWAARRVEQSGWRVVHAINSLVASATNDVKVEAAMDALQP